MSPKEFDHNPDIPLHGEHLAYVIYTSGSTGRPKGAANRHRSLHSRLAWMQQAYALGEDDTVLQKTPFSFDVSVWEFFWPLMVGAKLAVAAPGDHRDPERLVRSIERHRVGTLHFVPSMLQAFLSHLASQGGAATAACASLRRIVCSGEALPAEARNGVLEQLPRAALHNLYGPTEAAIDVTHWTCRDDGASQVPIGRPISGTQTRVLDARLNEAPIGAAGELYLGGVNLARGYLGRPGLTSERFIADPFEPAARLYRTGDLARWNHEGQLEYLGRIDHQVKIRGLRIELGEVEAQLLSQPEVREAVVVALHRGAAGTGLVAYVSLHAQAQAGPDAAARHGPLKDRLRQRLGLALPDYMVPGALVVMEALPLNANGKVDRKALPVPEEAAGERVHEAPRGEAEEALAAVWCEVLGLDRVGRGDNFFELGGHSLLALRVVAMVRARVAAQAGPALAPLQRLDLQRFMSQPTIAGAIGDEAARPGPVDPLTLLNKAVPGAPPLFCIHAGLGTVLGYLPLAKALNGGRPVFGLACRTLNDPAHRDTSLRRMAADYGALLRAAQPEGPYHLLGWSLGGALAVLVAEWLEARGQAVAFIGLVDSTLPTAHTVAPSGRDWREAHLRLLRELGVDVAEGTRIPATVPDPLDAEAPLVQWTRGAMGGGAPSTGIAEFDRLTAEEVVRIFLVDRCLARALDNSVEPLPRVAAGPIHCWWTASREPSEVRAMTAQLGAHRVVHSTVDADHLRIVSHEKLLREVAAALEAARLGGPGAGPGASSGVGAVAGVLVG